MNDIVIKPSDFSSDEIYTLMEEIKRLRFVANEDIEKINRDLKMIEAYLTAFKLFKTYEAEWDGVFLVWDNSDKKLKIKKQHSIILLGASAQVRVQAHKNIRLLLDEIIDDLRGFN